jgi:hypothetical protein
MRRVHEEEEKPLSWTSHESLPSEQESLVAVASVASPQKSGRFDHMLTASALFFGLNLGLTLLMPIATYYLFKLIPISDNAALSIFRYHVMIGVYLSFCGYITGKITGYIAPKRAISGILLGGFTLYLYVYKQYLEGRFIEMLFKHHMDTLNQVVTVGLALLFFLPVVVALRTVRKRRS